MANIRSVLKFRRRREGKTNYKSRLALLKSGSIRIVVRKSLKNILIQFVEYAPTGDKVLMSISSRSLLKYSWNASRSNTPAAYLIGLLAGKKVLKELKGKDFVLDFGMFSITKGNVLTAVLKGLIDSGLNLPHDPEIIPSEERISGKHISNYAGINNNAFSGYKKKSIDPNNLDKLFNEAKEKILNE